MEMSPLSFIYIENNTLDSLFLKDSMNEKKITEYVLKSGSVLTINKHLYDSFFLKNPKVVTRLQYIILDEIIKLDTISKNDLVCYINRDVCELLYKEFSKEVLNLENKSQTFELLEFLDKLRKFEIYSVIKFRKDDSWFNYEEAKKNYDFRKNEATDMLKD